MIKWFSYLLLTLATGCVSISPIETHYKQATNVVISGSNEELIEIKFADMGSKLCVSVDQKKFLRMLVSKYFLTEDTKKATILMRQNFNGNIAVGALNATISVLTFSIVPMYYDTSFEFLVTTEKEKNSSSYYAFVTDSGLVSILAVPFIFARNQNSVRRNNFENGLFLSSKQGPTNNEALAKAQSYTPETCTSFTKTKLQF